MTKKNVLFFSFLFFSLSLSLFPQDIFDSALQEKRFTYELNGYVRAGSYMGPLAEGEGSESKSMYGETSLKLRLRKGAIGGAFAEIRIKEDIDNENDGARIILREGYVDAHLGAFDMRIGQQVIVWGKADGYNPTNVITPYNFLSFSPDEDDRRNSNFLFRLFWNHLGENSTFRMEAIWIPLYKASVLPFQKAVLPQNAELLDGVYPNESVSNSGFALKLNYFGSLLDGSISYFNGYIPMPGLSAEEVDNSLQIFPISYRAQVIGMDFSTTAGNFGLKVEIAYKIPEKKEDIYQSIPCSQIEYVFGADREYGHFSIIIQYSGKYTFNFTRLKNSDPAGYDFIRYKICLWNRMLSSQIEEWQHSVSLRPSWNIFHEKLHMELLGSFNFSTEELFLKPKITYELSDSLDITVGAQVYLGPEETLYGEIDKSLSAGFLECKAFF
jgi:hypothetical protein